MTSNIDEQVRRAMRAAADEIEPPVQGLVDRGLARGRRLRRRHRIAVVGAGLVAAAVVASGALVAVNPDAGRDVLAALGRGDGGVASGFTSDGEPVAEQAVLVTLEALLPPGEITVEYADMNSTGGVLNWGIVYDDGDGASYMFGITGVTASAADLECDPDRDCQLETLSDGSQLKHETGTYGRGQASDRLVWSVELIRPDGFIFSLTEINAPTETDSEVSRAEPPLSLDELTAVATDTRWGALVTEEARDIVAEREREFDARMRELEKGDAALMSSEDVLETLIELLPPGEITDGEALPQDVVEGMRGNPAAIVTFDDGAGAANVSVTLYDFPTGAGCQQPSPNVQCTEKILDDGSVLRITQRPTYTDGRQPELIEWWATLERPDGLEIHLQQNNALGEKDVPATRPLPPLTVEQMEAIVTSDRWDVFQIAPDRQNDIREFRERNAAASRRFADALGAGWAPPEVTRFGYRPEAVPAGENKSAMPNGYASVLMSRDVLEGDRSYVDRVCEGWSEKGREWDACVAAASPSDEPMHLQWSRSVDHAQSVPHDELWVMYENEDGDVIRVMLGVSDDPDLSTLERRAAIVAWIEQQIDSMIAAATADDATAR